MIPYSKSFRFQMIWDTLSSEDNRLTVDELCEYTNVSKSGYYYWLRNRANRDEREEADRHDFELILAAYKKKGYKKGSREIHMALLHNDPPYVINIKKILRLMKKFGLKCPVRKIDPYRKMMKATYESKVAPNILDRRFDQFPPRTVFLTDITYIPILDDYENKRFVYLSVIMDSCTKEVLAYKVSKNLQEDFVLACVKQLLKKHRIEKTKQCLIHSDQGVHYTSIQFQKLLQDNNIRQSMSRRGNCWDNAPQESFFGHMKDDLSSILGKRRKFSQVQEEVDKWIDYYNNERYQWRLAKLSPCEYYQFVTTGEYPLKVETDYQIPKWKDPSELFSKSDDAEQATE